MFGGFLKPAVKVIKRLDKLGNITQSLEELQKRDVLIGVPQEKSSRPGEEPTNAELMFLHTNGAPMHNIPARPVLQPAIWENREKIAKVQGQVFKDALEGKKDQMNADIEKVGMVGQNFAKGWFLDPRNAWAPNSPITIARKGSDKPLIDTGALRNSIVYVIRQNH